MASAAASESLPWGPWTTDEEMFQIYADQNQRWRDLWQKLAPGRPWSEAMDLVFLYEDKEYLQKRVKEWRDRAQIYQTSVVKLKERQEVLLQMLAQKEKASKALEADKKAMAAEIEALKAKNLQLKQQAAIKIDSPAPTHTHHHHHQWCASRTTAAHRPAHGGGTTSGTRSPTSGTPLSGPPQPAATRATGSQQHLRRPPPGPPAAPAPPTPAAPAPAPTAAASAAARARPVPPRP